MDICCSSLMLSTASLSLRPRPPSRARSNELRTYCWVIVEPPCCTLRAAGVLEHRPHDPLGVHAVVLVEVAVLDRQHRLLHDGRDLGERHVDAIAVLRTAAGSWRSRACRGRSADVHRADVGRLDRGRRYRAARCGRPRRRRRRAWPASPGRSGRWAGGGARRCCACGRPLCGVALRPARRRNRRRPRGGRPSRPAHRDRGRLGRGLPGPPRPGPPGPEPPGPRPPPPPGPRPPRPSPPRPVAVTPSAATGPGTARLGAAGPVASGAARTPVEPAIVEATAARAVETRLHGTGPAGGPGRAAARTGRLATRTEVPRTRCRAPAGRGTCTTPPLRGLAGASGARRSKNLRGSVQPSEAPRLPLAHARQQHPAGRRSRRGGVIRCRRRGTPWSGGSTRSPGTPRRRSRRRRCGRGPTWPSRAPT